MIQVGLVGCGAMAHSVKNFIEESCHDKMKVQYVYDQENQSVKNLIQENKDIEVCKSVKDLCLKSDLIIEMAHPTVVFEVVLNTLNQGKECIIMSVGGLLLDEVRKLIDLKKTGKVYVPSGAIGGIDAIKAATYGQIKTIKIETTKPVKTLPSSIQPQEGMDEWIVFEGRVQEAVQNFPKNINVAATLALAVRHQCPVQVKIKASKVIKVNQHRIIVEAQSGRIESTFSNQPHPDNPRTSYQAVLSIFALIDRMVEPVVIGS